MNTSFYRGLAIAFPLALVLWVLLIWMLGLTAALLIAFLSLLIVIKCAS